MVHPLAVEVAAVAAGYSNQDQRRDHHFAVEVAAVGLGHRTSCLGVLIVLLIQTTDQSAGAGTSRKGRHSAAVDLWLNLTQKRQSTEVVGSVIQTEPWQPI
jgi:hypothetical protein